MMSTSRSHPLPLLFLNIFVLFLSHTITTPITEVSSRLILQKSAWHQHNEAQRSTRSRLHSAIIEQVVLHDLNQVVLHDLNPLVVQIGDLSKLGLKARNTSLEARVKAFGDKFPLHQEKVDVLLQSMKKKPVEDRMRPDVPPRVPMEKVHDFHASEHRHANFRNFQTTDQDIDNGKLNEPTISHETKLSEKNPTPLMQVRRPRNDGIVEHRSSKITMSGASNLTLTRSTSPATQSPTSPPPARYPKAENFDNQHCFAHAFGCKNSDSLEAKLRRLAKNIESDTASSDGTKGGSNFFGIYFTKRNSDGSDIKNEKEINMNTNLLSEKTRRKIIDDANKQKVYDLLHLQVEANNFSIINYTLNRFGYADKTLEIEEKENDEKEDRQAKATDPISVFHQESSASLSPNFRPDILSVVKTCAFHVLTAATWFMQDYNTLRITNPHVDGESEKNKQRGNVEKVTDVPEEPVQNQKSHLVKVEKSSLARSSSSPEETITERKIRNEAESLVIDLLLNSVPHEERSKRIESINCTSEQCDLGLIYHLYIKNFKKSNIEPNTFNANLPAICGCPKCRFEPNTGGGCGMRFAELLKASYCEQESFNANEKNMVGTDLGDICNIWFTVSWKPTKRESKNMGALKIPLATYADSQPVVVHNTEYSTFEPAIYSSAKTGGKHVLLIETYYRNEEDWIHDKELTLNALDLGNYETRIWYPAHTPQLETESDILRKLRNSTDDKKTLEVAQMRSKLRSGLIGHRVKVL